MFCVNIDKRLKYIKKYWKKNPIPVYNYLKNKDIVIPLGKHFRNHLIAVHFFYLLSKEENITYDSLDELRSIVCKYKDFKEISVQDFWEMVFEANNEMTKCIALGMDPTGKIDTQLLESLNKKIETMALIVSLNVPKNKKNFFLKCCVPKNYHPINVY